MRRRAGGGGRAILAHAHPSPYTEHPSPYTGPTRICDRLSRPDSDPCPFCLTEMSITVENL